MSNDKRKRTPWFPADVKPVRDGVYRVKYGRPFYRLFKDGRWLFGSRSIQDAALSSNVLLRSDALPWRGLAKDPSK